MFSLMVTGYVLQSIMGENGESKAGDVDSGVGLECYKQSTVYWYYVL